MLKENIIIFAGILSNSVSSEPMAVRTESESGCLNHSKQCQSFFLSENELNSAVVVISG